MFNIGFISEKAPLFMDIVSLYFFILPLILIYIHIFLLKKEYFLYLKIQIGLFISTMIIISIFEICIILESGFSNFLNTDSITYLYFIYLLIFHIIVAILAIIGWIIMLIKNYDLYQKYNNKILYNFKYINFYRILLTLLILTSYSGNIMYIILFFFE
jgi:hypothetical protein